MVSRDWLGGGGGVGAGGGGRPVDVHFSATAGGLVCGACEPTLSEKYRLDGAATAGLAALAAAQAGAKVALPDKQANGVNRMLAYHVAHQLGRPLRMARYAFGGP